MAQVAVRPLDDEHFEVTVEENGSTSMHVVTATKKHVSLLCEDCEPERLVEASMHFLLDREPKESILNQFDLDFIASFFPDYPSAIHDYL